MLADTPNVPDGEPAQGQHTKRRRRPVTGARLDSLRAQVAKANADRKLFWKRQHELEGKR